MPSPELRNLGPRSLELRNLGRDGVMVIPSYISG